MTKFTKSGAGLAGFGLLLGTVMFIVTQNLVWLGVGIALAIPAELVVRSFRRIKK